MTALRVFVSQGVFPQDPQLHDDLLDVLILGQHPGWTFDDLERMPQRLLDVEAELAIAREWQRTNNPERAR